MELKIIDKQDQEQIKSLEKMILERGQGKEHLVGFLDLSYETDENQINECLVKKDPTITNASFYKGTKDNGLVELSVINLEDREFLKESVDYALNGLNVKLVTVFTEKISPSLESLGFESLGEEQGRITYIKEKVLEDTVGRMK